MSLELPLALDAGHYGVMTASPGGSGWDVKIDVDGVTVLRSHVSDWHRVERLRTRVEVAHQTAVSRSERPRTRSGGAGRA